MPQSGESVRVRPVVLAGGDSSRFASGNKVFARLNGRSLLGHVVVTATEAVGKPPIVAVRDDEQHRAVEHRVTEDLPISPTFVTDEPAFRGPLAGLFAASSHLDQEWLLLVGCDMPLLDVEVVAWLLGRCQGSMADAIVPKSRNGIEPLHALYRRTAVETARDRLGATQGLYSLLDKVSDVDVIPSEEAPDSLTRSAYNVNTIDDLTALRNRESDRQL